MTATDGAVLFYVVESMTAFMGAALWVQDKFTQGYNKVYHIVSFCVILHRIILYIYVFAVIEKYRIHKYVLSGLREEDEDTPIFFFS